MKKLLKETSVAMLGCLMLVASAGSYKACEYRNLFDLARFVATLSDHSVSADVADLGGPRIALTGIKKVIYGA